MHSKAVINSGRFKSIDTGIKGLVLIERKKIEDSRGFLSRLFCPEELLAEPGVVFGEVSQINHTVTSGTGFVRGMHFQLPPFAETKLVTCTLGKVFDVAVDLRKGSATYGQWRGYLLSGLNAKTLVIPKGLAHGFQALSEEAHMIYVHDKPYSPDHENGISPTDPTIRIRWPKKISFMSERDKSFCSLNSDFKGIQT